MPADPDRQWLHANIDRAQAIFIMPQMPR